MNGSMAIERFAVICKAIPRIVLTQGDQGDRRHDQIHPERETRAAVGSMSEGVEEVKRGMEESIHSGDALEDILAK